MDGPFQPHTVAAHLVHASSEACVLGQGLTAPGAGSHHSQGLAHHLTEYQLRPHRVLVVRVFSVPQPCQGSVIVSVQQGLRGISCILAALRVDHMRSCG